MIDNIIPQFRVFMAPDITTELDEVFQSGYIGQGPKVEKFEDILKSKLFANHLITVNSGTSALWLALHLIGIGPGDKVISTPMTCSATNEVIHLLGAEIIWADVDEWGNINTIDVASKMNNDIKAIMAVDWGGIPCDYQSLKEIAGDVPIVEDAAHAFLSLYRRRSLFNAGADYICYSFQAIKHLTTGDGGALITPSEQYERAKLLRWYGLDRTKNDAMRCRQDITEAGFKFHMNDINATIGLENIKYTSDLIEKTRDNATYYDRKLSPLGISLIEREYSFSSYWLYTIHIKQPLEFESYMKKHGVMVSQTHNRNDEFTIFEKYKTRLPNLDNWFSTMCCIPVGWWVTETDRKYIAGLVESWVVDGAEDA